MNTLFEYGLAYLELGFSVVPVNRKKNPVEDWKTFQDRMPTPQELYALCQLPWARGLAVVCGPASAGLEVIDMDVKYDLTGTLRQDFEAAIRRADPDLFSRLVINKTRSGGRHYIYRCQQVQRNQRLARRPPTDQELAANPKAKPKVLLETRGIKGIIVVPPSPGYQTIAGDFTLVPEITIAERDLLFDIARSFNLVKQQAAVYKPRPQQPAGEGLTSMDDYDNRGDVVALLEKHGWVVVGTPTEITKLRRPGDTDKDSSGNYNSVINRFSTFSTNTDFEAETPYKPSAVFAVLECDGDYHKAARELGRLGYGDPRRRRPPKTITTNQVARHR